MIIIELEHSTVAFGGDVPEEESKLIVENSYDYDLIRQRTTDRKAVCLNEQ
jgi:hypothetical protein